MSEKNETVSQYLARIGKKGGQARAARHSKKELSKWGKLGGRPKQKKEQK
jgi:hypothetical protein